MMKKKFVAVLLSVCLIFTAVPAAVYASVWSGSVSSTAPPIGADRFYLLSTGEQLAWFARTVNSGNNEINGRIVCDIQLNSGTLGSSSHQWTPIGTASNPFMGSFDGGGYTVSGLYINNPTLDYQGLFGYVGERVQEQAKVDGVPITDSNGNPVYIYVSYGGSISNVVLAGASVSGLGYVGGIVGYAVATEIGSCSVSGSITAAGHNVGGIIGYAFTGTEVIDSINYAAISGLNRVGGIAGILSGESAVDVCVNLGSVSGENYVGGIVGTVSGSYVVHSYSRGSVAGLSRIGGLVGYSAYGITLYSYVVSTVNGTGTNVGSVFGQYSSGSEMKKVYYDREVCNISDTVAIAAETVVMLDEDFIITLNYGTDDFVEDYFDDNDGYPIFVWQLVAWSGDLSEPNTNAGGTYLISNGAELAWFAALVNGTIQNVAANPAANAIVTTDILLNLAISENSTIWTPIGANPTQYTGVFNGNGHRISGVFTSFNKNTTDIYKGLFGIIGSSGIVRNLFVESSAAYGHQYVGGIAGYNAGTIENCSSETLVSATNHGGGIAGFNNGAISVCCNTGSVSSTAKAGGITGENSSAGSIIKCFNTGDINTNGSLSGTGNLTDTGGIAGINYNLIQNCYNIGYVKGTQRLGGISGDNHMRVEFCYNAGYIFGTLINIGAVVGKNSYAGSVVNGCYFNSTDSNASDSFASAVTHGQMVEDGALTDYMISLYTDVWVKSSASEFFDYYPQLKAFSNSQYAYLVHESEKSARVLQTIFDVRVDIDGEIPTYYRELAPAMTYIGENTATAVIIQNTTMTETASVNGNVTLTTDGKVRTVTRSWQIEGVSMIDVENGATLTLSGGESGSDEVPLLYIDGGAGNNLTQSDTMFYLSAESTLKIEAGAVIQNNSTNVTGSAVYSHGANLIMTGGLITGNRTTTDGGAIYAGGISVMEITGGKISGNSAANGGGVYVGGNFAEVEIGRDALISGNTATNGGGVYINKGTLSLTGGSVSGNSATNGGGFYVGPDGTLSQTAGTVSENTATGFGNGVYDNGTFSMSDDAMVDIGNDVYLTANTLIDNADTLSLNGTAATITAQNHATGVQVLGGSMVAKNYSKFAVTMQNGKVLYINSTGYLIDRETTNVARLTTYGISNVAYTSVQEAINVVEAIEPDDGITEVTAIITLIGDDVIDEPITLTGSEQSDVLISIVSDGAERSIIRANGYSGNMIVVGENASLDLGSKTFDSDDELVIIDGGYFSHSSLGGSILVNNGKLNIYNGAVICNNRSTTGDSAILNNGTLNVSGGFIRNNYSSGNGGAIMQAAGSTLIKDGLVSANTATNGGAVYAAGGTLKTLGGTLSGNSANNGGAVYVSNSTFSFYGGEITENSAATGGGIFVDVIGTVNMMCSTIDVEVGTSTPALDEEGNPVTDEYGNVQYEWTFVTNTYDTEPSLSSNTATQVGGGVFLMGTMEIKGGTFASNTAANGKGIYVSGALKILGNGCVDGNNEVYLPRGKKITISGAITSASPVMKLMIPTYELGLSVLTDTAAGANTALYCGLFKLYNSDYFITSAGNIDTVVLCLADDSEMVIEEKDGERFLLGLDPNDTTSICIKANFKNTYEELVIRDLNGNEISEEDFTTTGYVLRLMDNGTVLDEIYIVLVGDMDLDNAIDGMDANYVSAIIGGLFDEGDLSSAQLRAADANNDYAIDSMDTYALIQAGLMNGSIAQKAS